MARKTLFLKKEQGSLNLKEPEGHNLAMGIKTPTKSETK